MIVLISSYTNWFSSWFLDNNVVHLHLAGIWEMRNQNEMNSTISAGPPGIKVTNLGYRFSFSLMIGSLHWFKKKKEKQEVSSLWFDLKVTPVVDQIVGAPTKDHHLLWAFAFYFFFFFPFSWSVLFLFILLVKQTVLLYAFSVQASTLRWVSVVKVCGTKQWHPFHSSLHLFQPSCFPFPLFFVPSHLLFSFQ